MTTKSIAFSQPSTPDSLRNIAVVQWRLERLINDAYQLRALELYAAKLEQEAAISNRIIIIQDSSMQIKDLIIAGHNNIISDWEARFENQKEITTLEKRQKRRWRVVAFVAVGVIVWQAVDQ